LEEDQVWKNWEKLSPSRSSVPHFTRGVDETVAIATMIVEMICHSCGEDVSPPLEGTVSKTERSQDKKLLQTLWNGDDVGTEAFL